MQEEPDRRIHRPRQAALALLAAVAGASFALGALVSERESSPRAPTADVEWSSASAVGFLELGSALLDDDAAALDRAWTESVAASLAAGSSEGGSAETQARAASLLGAAAARSDVPRATREAAAGALLAHLEARRAAGSRGAVGSGVIAAAALARAPHVAGDPTGGRTTSTLAGLAAGEASHPDLPVRVECAAAALARATDPALRPDLAAFLLAVLRAETPDQDRSPRSWERITTLAWVKTRAAKALSDAAGTELRFRPDGSWAHQTGEADRLERALGAGASPR